MTKSLHGGSKMRRTPATSVLAGNLFQSILHSLHRHTSNQRTDGQHQARQAVLPPLSGNAFILPNDRLQDFTRTQQTFAGFSLLGIPVTRY